MNEPTPADDQPQQPAASHPSGRAPGGGLGRLAGTLWRRKWIRVYLVLLALSHLVIAVWNPRIWPGREAARQSGATHLFVDAQAAPDPVENQPAERLRLSLWRWDPPADAPARAHPVFLLHGSPSAGGLDFAAYASWLSQRGFTVYALDRPGFGNSTAWVRSYSLRANARAALAAMDALQLRTVHLAGWSQGGAVAVWVADMAPDRVATLSLLASLGIQEGEGSGDYYFEHAKYALGYVGLVLLPEALPHFNLLGTRATRHAFVRDFWDSDQRPLREVMSRLRVPTLIVHGRRDRLVPAWVAEEHHELMPGSRLVMLDDAHFFVVGKPARGTDDASNTNNAAIARHAQASFLIRHDGVDRPPLPGRADFAPRPDERPVTILGREISSRDTPWWLAIPIIAIGTMASEDLTMVLISLLVIGGQLDIGVAMIALIGGILVGDLLLWLIGRVFGRRLLKINFFRKRISDRTLTHWQTMLDTHTAKAILLARFIPGARMPVYIISGMLTRKTWSVVLWFTLAVLIWTPLVMLLTALVGRPLLSFFQDYMHGPVAIVLALVVLMLLLKLVSYEATPGGRRLLRSDLRRLGRPELWPSWLLYAPVVLWALLQSIRHGGLLVFTCVNPGIPNGGGVVGEPKFDILTKLHAAKERAGISDDELVILHAELIPAGGTPDERAERALNLIHAQPRLGGFPVVLKPNASQRGRGMRIARSADDVKKYFRVVEAPVQIQRYHPGPCEAGVLWARRPDRGLASGPAGNQTTGHLFSITRKTFPEIVGDGQHTIEQLIWAHPRHSLQPRIFLERFADRLDEVSAEGQVIRLAHAGNHAQGTLFTDGSDLVTAELTVLFDRLARAFAPDENGLGGLDYGRFDVRFQSEEALASGRGIAIIELNGTFAESTNMYDPTMPLSSVYRTLFRQWALLYTLGGLRRRAGHKPMPLRRFASMVRHEGLDGAAIPIAD
jgi:pimeloyl-ACP methyl ester carboxylesterase/membrane protein DedA with SNARE-associated domain